jgi:hypothetical protein
MTRHRWSVAHNWHGGVCDDCGKKDPFIAATAAGDWSPETNKWKSSFAKALYDLRPCRGLRIIEGGRK